MTAWIVDAFTYKLYSLMVIFLCFCNASQTVGCFVRVSLKYFYRRFSANDKKYKNTVEAKRVL